MQLGIILELFRLKKNHVRAFWINDELILINLKKISYWSKQVFQTFCVDWCFLVDSFGDLFTQDERTRIIKSHSRNTGLFGLKRLLVLRSQGTLSYNNYKTYKTSIRRAGHLPPVLVVFISVLPKRVLSFLYRVVCRIKSKAS